MAKRIPTRGIADNAVDASKIPSGAVASDELAAGAVDATKLAADADTQRHIRRGRNYAATNLN